MSIKVICSVLKNWLRMYALTIGCNSNVSLEFGEFLTVIKFNDFSTFTALNICFDLINSHKGYQEVRVLRFLPCI